MCRGICALGPPVSSPAEKLLLCVVACEMKMEMPWGSCSLPATAVMEMWDGAGSDSTLPNPYPCPKDLEQIPPVAGSQNCRE